MCRNILTHTLKEITWEFNCCETVVRFDRLGVTRKKDGALPGTEPGKGKDLSERDWEVSVVDTTAKLAKITNKHQ